MGNPKVSIIVLNWNGRDDTLECLKSLMTIAYDNFEVLVVDNGSTDGSVRAAQDAFPDVKIIETGRNLGYTGGNNVGIRRALETGADYVLVLNNDTIVSTDLLIALTTAAQTHPDGALFSPRIYEAQQPRVIYYDGARWNAEAQVVEFITDESQNGDSSKSPVRPTVLIHGCAVFFPVSVISRLGMLDERFYLLFEETDWSFRSIEAGFRNYVVSSAAIWHKGAVSFGSRSSPLRQYFHIRNYLLFGERHLGFFDFVRLFHKRVFHDLLSFTARGDNWSLRSELRRHYWNLRKAVRLWRTRDQDPVFCAKCLGLRDYVLRRFGNCPDEVRALTSSR